MLRDDVIVAFVLLARHFKKNVLFSKNENKKRDRIEVLRKKMRVSVNSLEFELGVDVVQLLLQQLLLHLVCAHQQVDDVIVLHVTTQLA